MKLLTLCVIFTILIIHIYKFYCFLDKKPVVVMCYFHQCRSHMIIKG